MGTAFTSCAPPEDDVVDPAANDIAVRSSALTSSYVRIAAGSTTSAQGSFIADTDFTNGTPLTRSTAAIVASPDVVNPGTAADYPLSLYKNQRFGTFSYTLPGFPVGSRNVVRLHFCETNTANFAVGKRKFDVTINGTKFLANFDVFFAAGNKGNTPVVKEWILPPDQNGQYLIQFTTVLDAATVSGIEINKSVVPQGTSIHAGGGDMGAFLSDVGFSGGSTKSRSATITTNTAVNPAPAAIYLTQRYGNFSYTVPGFAANTMNMVRLHFAETNSANFVAGNRLFNVSINGTQVLTNFDIFATAGANNAFVRDFWWKADASGKYTIQFTTVKDAATVSAVEVLRKVPWFVKRDMTSAEYQAEFDARARAGYRLKDVDGYTVGGTTRFVAIWDLTPGVAYRAAHNMTQANFASLFNSNLAEGFRLVRFNGYAVGATEAYAAIWEATVNPPAMSSTVQMTSDQYQAEFNKQLAAGFRLKHVSCYTINGQERYGALFEKVSSPAWSARHLMTATDLTNEIASRKAAGFRIVDVTGCNVGGTDHYAAIFENSALPTFEEHADTGTGFDLRQDDLYRQGAQPATVSGYAPSSGAEKFAAIWQNNTYTQTQLDAIDNLIKSFFTTNPTVPSVSLAISKNERLVYAKAFDSPTLGTQSPLAHVANVYRIASISKPLTGMVIGRMIELGLLSYSSPVFGTNGILGNTYGDFSSNPNVGKITVRHLLNHTSGIPGAADSALIGPQQDVSKTIAQLITAGLNMVPSDAANAPGSKPAVYSNLGYDILARVAEKVGNGGYEILTQANIMLPSGVTAMRIGPETQAARAPNEVTYFPTANHTTPPQDPGPYQLTMRRMDGNGGWIASPIDLLKVTAHNDLQPRVIDILGPQTLSIMSTPPAGAVEAGGWQIFPGMWFHNGNMWGTLTKLTRFDTGFSVATLTNKWVAGDTTNLDKLRDDLMALPALPAGSWTELDLFN